ncbi:MAG: MerR family transcriptional regulator [Rhodospirillales bacterium]|nr:MerR family transcriptional regulator [Rhodospirillales bacterium]MCB9995519.1 MerR family transcriptional regulator [Rhodospirillales bacterium]
MSTAQKPHENGAEQQTEQKSAETHTVNAKPKKAASAFRTISEVADELDVQQHVLRFWETKFTQVKPLKRGGGRRYYRPEDVALLKKIHHLLYTEGYTIKGVQKLLKGQGKQQIIADDFMPDVANQSAPAAEPKAAPQKEVVVKEGLSDKQRSILNAMLGDLKELRDMLKGEDQ